MSAFRILAIVVPMVLSAQMCLAEQSAVQVASSFLPPGARMATVDRYDPKTGRTIESRPAVLDMHFVSENASDVVFAYTNTSQEPQARVLFIAILHKATNGYFKIFEKSYYESFLWSQDFATTGLRIVRLPGDSKDSVMVATARGASLGVQAELYRWEDGLGATNTMPSHPAAHRISLISEKDRFVLKLSFEKYPGEKGVPRPMLYRWDGRELKLNDG
jgi:hypothetical protein